MCPTFGKQLGERDSTVLTDPERHVKVDDIIVNFSCGLRELAPCAERVGITWRSGEAYDEWDGLADAVFAALVAEPLSQATP
jgi:hypothetical protein